MSFLRKRRADRVAHYLGELIHTLSDGREKHGPDCPEGLLRGLGSAVAEEIINGQRVLKLFLPVTTKDKFLLTLTTTPDSGQTLMIEGQDVYRGFSVACALPPQAVMLVLKRGALGKAMPQARLLYAACRKMPNAVEQRRR
jgi:hypothetical protein